ncbi:MAG: toxin-antitoxin system HicB family antitoxin [Coriobacteriia bacterium]|nr:toxin-antitoxin system HicB family antitoxin [Coriobacteriia bacterium]MBS5478331.1 toxin-antitoxin system HicB family antitoxin [Coriobacteriia bacterium]
MYQAEEYTFRVFYSQEDHAFIATAAEFPSLSNVGDSQADALAGLVTLIQDVLSDLQEEGAAAPEPLGRRRYSGKISLRITPQQHRRLAMEAAEQGVSINQLLVSRV